MTDKPTKKGNTAPRGRRRKEPPEPPKTDEEIIALVKQAYPFFDPSRFVPEEDGSSPIYGCNRSWLGRRYEEWRVEAFGKVDALRAEGLSNLEALRRIYPLCTEINVAFDSFRSGYQKFKRDDEEGIFKEAILANDGDAVVRMYRTLAKTMKAKLNID